MRGTYGQWTGFHELQGADDGLDACPAHDGVCNLVKFAAGLDPFTPAVQSDFFRTSMDAGNGNLNLDLTLSRTPTDLATSIFKSGDLGTWIAPAGTISPIVTTTARQTQRLAVPLIPTGSFFKVGFLAE